MRAVCFEQPGDPAVALQAGEIAAPIPAWDV